MQVGKRQTIETLISEEVLLFAKYLRDEQKEWMPRFQLARANTSLLLEKHWIF